ncbi:MAG: RNA methyltransferase [Myxococcaceae bacterium]
MGSLRANLNVVCHQLRSPDNLGAVARLMANFGFARLTLSDPVTYAFREAEKLAVGAGHLLERLTVAHTLGEALADAVYAVGSTSRTALKNRAAITPDEAARRLSEEAKRGRVALVFGGEKRGLSDEELSLCQDVLVVPTDEAQPSMNLSQAVAVLLYLCAREDQPPPAVPEPTGARLETLKVLEGLMQTVLLDAGYLNPQAPEHAVRELVRSLARARLSQREAEMWLSAFQHLRRHSSGVAK